MNLRIYKHHDLIQSIQLEPGQSYLVGRKETCDIQLEKLPGISREHFEIEQDSTGQWRINVLSEMRLLEWEGEDRKDFQINGSGEFRLAPYVFKYEISAADAAPADSGSDKHTPIPVQEPPSPDASDEASLVAPLKEDDLADTAEQTVIRNFNGLPYIKIIGQNGKKSEYFRLEGNLWVVGNSDAASVFIAEPGAAQSHFEISKTEKGYFVTDLGSQQGTELNGQRLPSKRPSRLLSGDIIAVGTTSIQFELRDKAFDRKVSNIPLQMYKNPLVFFDQDVAMVSLEDEIPEMGSAEELNEERPQPEKKSNRGLFVAVAVICVIMAVMGELTPKEENAQSQVQASDPFSQLSPAEQKIVHQTYKLINQLYLGKNYELALAQIDKLHSIIPVYKKSREIEEYCINARDVQKQRALIAQQRREQRQLTNQVHSLISQCEQQYRSSQDVDGARACLAPAADLDPNNPRISQLITEVTARGEEQKIRRKIAQEQADKVRRGRELFQKAKNLHNKQRWIEAMEAYENHIHSGLPDPKRLVKKSKRSLATIEKQVRNKKRTFMDQAKTKYGGSELRESIRMARAAQQVDPFDPEISSFLFEVEKELRNKMKAIYMDSVIEERFGNLEASRTKWEEIIKKDIKDGEYFKKAHRKLREYGFKH